LEMASISSYILAGFAKGTLTSSEDGMKYFIYGAFATATKLYGMSLIYGITAQTNLYVIGSLITGVEPLPASANAVFLLAAVLIIVGFGVKYSAGPFHFRTPDIYEGAPTPFTAFVSAASTAAGFAVFIRLFSAGVLGGPSQDNAWWAMSFAMCIIT